MLYLKENKTQIMYHTIIVDYLMNWCKNETLKRTRVPYHCQSAGLPDKYESKNQYIYKTWMWN